MPSNELDMDKGSSPLMNGLDSDHMESPGLDLSKKKSPRSKNIDKLASPSQMVLTGSMVRMGADGIPGASGFQGNMQRFPKFHEFQCPLCPRSYAQKCSLYRHMKVHKDDKVNENEVNQSPCPDGGGVYKCPFCIASYSNSASLNVHVRTHAVGYRDMVRRPEDSPHKDDEKLFPCPLCSRVFQRRSRLTVHLNISHRNEHYGDLPKEEDHDADVESDADDMDDARSRNGSMTPESPGVGDGTSPQSAFRCHLCGSSYTRRTNLNKHLEKRHSVDPSVLMSISGPEFPTADQLMTLNTVTPAKRRLLDDEMEQGNDDVVHKCPFCNFQTSIRHALFQHMTTTHAEADDFQSKLMDMVKNYDEEKSDSKATEPMEGDGEIFPCQFCSRVYMRKCNLTQHLKMHFHDEAELKKKRPHLMEEFMNEAEENLDDVKQIIELTKAKDDEKEEVHECAICGLTFGIKVSLILHLKMHERRALAKLKEKEKSPVEAASMSSPPPPLVRPGLSPQGVPPPMGGNPGGPHPHPQNPSAFVMTQDKDGKTTIHNQHAYMLSHMQVLNQVQHMIMYGRNPLLPHLPGHLPPQAIPGHLPPQAIPRKRLSTGSFDDENPTKRMRPGPKPGRHWKSLECDPNRRPVKKCSLCSFEIADTNQEGLLQHMAAMHGVSCKLCPQIKFFTKRDFDKHCAQVHSVMCNASEMEQLMVFGEILDSGNKVELVDSNDKETKSENGEGKADDGGSRPTSQPLNIDIQDHDEGSAPNSPGQGSFDGGMPYDSEDQGMANGGMRQICPKCGLHYAQKSSLNRHIRSHHHYSRVEEMIKAENLGLAPPPTHHVTPQPRKTTPQQESMKELGTMGLIPPPLIPMSHGLAPPLIPPPMMHGPNTSGVPAQGHLADINPTIARGLMYGLHYIPPPQLPILSPPMNKLQTLSTMPLARSSPLMTSEFSRSSSPDDEVTAINLSMNGSGVQDFTMKTLNSTSPQTASSSPASASPSAAPKGRSRRKPQVVQRIVRNTTLEEEELEDEGHKGQGHKVKDISSDESFNDYDMTDKNANHIGGTVEHAKVLTA